MFEFTTVDVSDKVQDNRPVDFTIDDVPDDIQDIRLVGLLYIEILESGNMTSTGDEVRDRAQAQKIKNHVAYWANIHPADATNKRAMIRFAMDVVNPSASIGSNDAQYAPSDGRSVLSFGSTFSTSGKPTFLGDAPPSDDVPPEAPPSVHSGDDSSIPGGSGRSRDAASILSTSELIAMLPKGAPAQGSFGIKVRKYRGMSRSAVMFFTFRIIGEPRLGDLLNSLRTRHMLPFYFPKLGFSYIGCRHFAYASLFAHH